MDWGEAVQGISGEGVGGKEGGEAEVRMQIK